MYTNPIDECLEKGEYHIERIRCPECNYVQQAEVLHTLPWPMRFHICHHCSYMIMESEWNCIDKVKIKIPFSMKRFFFKVTTLEVKFVLAISIITHLNIFAYYSIMRVRLFWPPLIIGAGIVFIIYLCLLVVYLREEKQNHRAYE